MYISLILLCAFIFRLINLNQSLWLDEAVVAKVVRAIPFHLIPSQFSPSDFHPPLYYLVVSLWTKLFGTSEIALRFPSILFSLVTGWFIYKIGLHLKNKQVALWASIFFLFNPLVIYYSQEARMYMMATMFLMIALYYLLLLIKENQNSKFKLKRTILFNLFSALSMFTFYGSAFFITAMIITGLFLVPKRRDLRGRGFWLSIGLLISLFLLSPLLYQQIMNARVGLADVKNWSVVLGKAELKNILMIFLKFATGRISWYPKWSYYIVAGIPTAIIWLSIALGIRKNKLLASLFILPLLFGLFVSLWAPMMMYFRYLYLIPVMSLLLASSTIEIKSNDKKKCGMTAIFIIFSFVYLLLPQFHREDWKGLTHTLQSESRVYMILPSSDPIAYYRDDIPVFELRTIETSDLPEYITIIPYTSEIYGFNYQQILKEKGCIKKSQMRFRGDLQLEEWICLRKA